MCADCLPGEMATGTVSPLAPPAFPSRLPAHTVSSVVVAAIFLFFWFVICLTVIEVVACCGPLNTVINQHNLSLFTHTHSVSALRSPLTSSFNTYQALISCV